jgi:hypothetical protein
MLRSRGGRLRGLLVHSHCFQWDGMRLALMKRLLSVSHPADSCFPFRVCILHLIRPFTAQSSTGLLLSFRLRSLSPNRTLWLLAAALLPILFLWIKSSSRRAKTLLALAGTMLLASAILSRQNHFEWMFHPAPPQIPGGCNRPTSKIPTWC